MSRQKNFRGDQKFQVVHQDWDLVNRYSKWLFFQEKYMIIFLACNISCFFGLMIFNSTIACSINDVEPAGVGLLFNLFKWETDRSLFECPGE